MTIFSNPINQESADVCGAETWTLTAEHVRRLTTLHKRCVWTILGVIRFQQFTSKYLDRKFGMAWSIADIVLDRRLHLGRMGVIEEEGTLSWAQEEVESLQMSGDLLTLGVRQEWAVQCREGVNEVSSCRKKMGAANRQSQEKTFVCIGISGDRGPH